jgi:hypothetical protein
VLFTVEGLCSVGGNLLQVGIFFYTSRRFGWGLRENFTLATAQGVVYVVAALLAHRVASLVAPRRALAALYVALAAFAALPLAFPSPAAAVAAVLAYTFTVGMCWPILESLVSTGLDAHALSRRISVYNVVWAGTGALTLAVNGAIIDAWPAGVFAITVIVHALSAVLIGVQGGDGAWGRASWGGEGQAGGGAGEHVGASLLPSSPAPQVPSSPAHPPSSTPAPPLSYAHLDAEPALLRVRTLALWLSRVSVPASYALIYALSALLPSLPTTQQLPIWAATLVGSAWLMARWLAFLLLGFSPWWHTRPRALLVAAWLMLVAFGGVALQPGALLWREGWPALDVAWLVLCQVVIGFAIGLIYSASLYFGMVLSDGSTEHGGYHEALIGLGSILGPGAGAIAQWVRPGQVTPGVVAVAGVLLLSTLVASGASAVASRRE